MRLIACAIQILVERCCLRFPTSRARSCSSPFVCPQVSARAHGTPIHRDVPDAGGSSSARLPMCAPTIARSADKRSGVLIDVQHVGAGGIGSTCRIDRLNPFRVTSRAARGGTDECARAAAVVCVARRRPFAA